MQTELLRAALYKSILNGEEGTRDWRILLNKN
jgi:hypothetical protein